MVRNIFIAITTVVLLAEAAAAQASQAASVQPAPHYSRAELQNMIAQARTPQQYNSLAAYFRQRQQVFENKAESEKQEWERRSQNVSGAAAKYPRPADSSRNRYQYFESEAARMGAQATRYDALAEQSLPSDSRSPSNLPQK